MVVQRNSENVMHVANFDLHVHGGLVLRLKGGVVFERQSDGVLLRNHVYVARIERTPNGYPMLMDRDGFVGLVPRLPYRVRRWLGAFHN